MANPRRGGHRSCAAALLLSSAIVAAPTLLAAQEGGELEPTEGTECCLYLLLPVGARATSMAGTITALQGVDGAYMNPAGLAGMDGNTFVVHHSDVGTSVPEQVDAFSLLITPWSIALAVSYQLIDNGESVVTDPFQQPTGELALRDHLVTASVGTELFAGLSAGANYKLYQQRIGGAGAGAPAHGRGPGPTPGTRLSHGVRGDGAGRPGRHLPARRVCARGGTGDGRRRGTGASL
ncbi:MAG: hypothetical protein P8177_14700 [Gemmatimonadota bacterium]